MTGATVELVVVATDEVLDTFSKNAAGVLTYVNGRAAEIVASQTLRSSETEAEVFDRLAQGWSNGYILTRTTG
jgi:hypothetical protein